MYRILVVCAGNICRSPLAEGILRKRAQEVGLSVFVDSAGTGSWHAGDPPDPRAIAAGRVHGIEIGDQRARKIRAEDFDKFDQILAMDEQNLVDVLARRPAGVMTPVNLITDFRKTPGPTDIPDPYYSSKFEPVIAMLEDCIAGLLDQRIAAQ
ncbi:MAG: low molecular weight phosphotyrosine protein phosphatase [Litoreibacter sp.]|nr:low molecular weight phosphotyrosine protein phosphatase [Litoreibacter sp.]